jgi:hypothetical protein
LLAREELEYSTMKVLQIEDLSMSQQQNETIQPGSLGHTLAGTGQFKKLKKPLAVAPHLASAQDENH